MKCSLCGEAIRGLYPRKIQLLGEEPYQHFLVTHLPCWDFMSEHADEESLWNPAELAMLADMKPTAEQRRRHRLALERPRPV